MSLVWDVVTCCVLVIGFISRASATHIEGEYLERHNEARARLGISDLEWSNSLESYATDYAEGQASYGCAMVHSNGPYGENLYWSSGYSSPSDAVDSWVEEGRDYNSNFNSCSFGRVCGHYTQVKTHHEIPRCTCPRRIAVRSVHLYICCTLVLSPLHIFCFAICTFSHVGGWTNADTDFFKYVPDFTDYLEKYTICGMWLGYLSNWWKICSLQLLSTRKLLWGKPIILDCMY
ncbi:hypothetical protein Mapa_015600 [Marchantia paleacea]|nr:hypothetical protein Mapa_015600 [Marchantia paleacea]